MLIASQRSSGRNRFRAVKSEVAFENRQALLTSSAKDLLQMTKLLTVFDVYDDETKALAALKK